MVQLYLPLMAKLILLISINSIREASEVSLVISQVGF